MSSDKELKIRAVIILDVIGRPPEHLIKSLEKIIEEIDKEKGITIKAKEIKKPVLMKDQKEFYTTFAEIELEMEEILHLAVLLFKYMPAHVEIISPEVLALTNNGWNEILNELTRRLHGYDEIARVMQIEKQMLMRKIQELGGKVPEQMPLSPKPVPEQKSQKKTKSTKSKSKKPNQK